MQPDSTQNPNPNPTPTPSHHHHHHCTHRPPLPHLHLRVHFCPHHNHYHLPFPLHQHHHLHLHPTQHQHPSSFPLPPSSSSFPLTPGQCQASSSYQASQWQETNRAAAPSGAEFLSQELAGSNILEDNEEEGDEEELEEVFVLTDEWAEFFAKSEAKRQLAKKNKRKGRK